MAEFNLDGADVGGRVLAAISREGASSAIDLSCRGARFRERVEWNALKFSRLDATEATFDRGLMLTNCEIRSDAILDRVVSPYFRLDRAVFAAATYLRGAQIATTKMNNVGFRGYTTFDDARLKQVTLRGVVFDAEARFRQLACADNANLRRVIFGTVASFQESRWGSLRFAGCEFDGPVQITGVAVEGRLYFIGCRFADSRIIELQSGGDCELRETTFERPLNLRVNAPRVSASHASFEQGVDLTLSHGAQLDLAGASLGGPSLIMTEVLTGDESPARLQSLAGTRLAGLTLRGLDLSACSFARAHTLDDVVISGRGQLSRAPWATGGLGQREVIVDEVDFWRARRPRRKTGSAGKDPGDEIPATPATLAETYRALRRGRENAKDRPGAADFYYGEMEMRRQSAPLVDRVVLAAYWLVCGYGLRASRALVAYLVVVGGLAVTLEFWGLSKHAPFADVLVYVLATTTVLQKPSLALALNTGGNYLEVAARLIGPAMFALMLLALRSRVRR
jgi:uncharacterized protein YjbI with pentapeptide repeats